MMNFSYLVLLIAVLGLTACDDYFQEKKEKISSDKSCAKLVAKGLRPIAEQQSDRFLGKVSEYTANCRGGKKALAYRDTVWVDWANYWATGDASTKANGREAITSFGTHLKPNGRGVDGALIDLVY